MVPICDGSSVLCRIAVDISYLPVHAGAWKLINFIQLLLSDVYSLANFLQGSLHSIIWPLRICRLHTHHSCCTRADASWLDNFLTVLLAHLSCCTRSGVNDGLLLPFVSRQFSTVVKPLSANLRPNVYELAINERPKTPFCAPLVCEMAGILGRNDVADKTSAIFPWTSCQTCWLN